MTGTACKVDKLNNVTQTAITTSNRLDIRQVTY